MWGRQVEGSTCGCMQKSVTGITNRMRPVIRDELKQWFRLAVQERCKKSRTEHKGESITGQRARTRLFKKNLLLFLLLLSGDDLYSDQKSLPVLLWALMFFWSNVEWSRWNKFWCFRYTPFKLLKRVMYNRQLWNVLWESRFWSGDMCRS
jgi:hypothetical protein